MMRRFTTVVFAATVLGSVLVSAAMADETGHLTGLERAAEATMVGLEKAQGKAADAPGQANRAKGLERAAAEPTGRERAAAAIDAALARGNGNAFGRGHSAQVLGILNGELPEALDELDHGEAVREMVHAFNELRKTSGE